MAPIGQVDSKSTGSLPEAEESSPLHSALLDASREIAPASPEAAEDYVQHSGPMTEDVDRQLLERTDLDRLIGTGAVAMMLDNHRNHVRFIGNVLVLGDYQLLARTLPWVYRSYLARGFSADYFPATLCAWRATVARHLRAAHASEVDAVYRWILAQHERLLTLSKQPIPAPTLHPDWSRATQQFTELLLRGQTQACWQMALEFSEEAQGLREFSLHVLQPAMYEIGHRWERGAISVAQEHLASAVVGRLQTLMYSQVISAKQTFGTAVVTSAPNEFHEIGPRMVSDFLELEGWHVHYLGSNTPTKDLLAFVLGNPVDLLLVSVSMPFNLVRCRDLIQAVRALKSADQLKIMVGGHALSQAGSNWTAVGADGYAADAESATRLARQWWHERNA